MNFITIIPARMGSTRFPGKPLAKIAGVAMIERCYTRSALCEELAACYVATCDQAIIDHMVAIHGHAVMTSDRHERATDRTAEALLKIEEKLGKQFDIIIMVQGDEPLIKPQMLSQIANEFLQDEKVKIVNLMSPITSIEELQNVNVVKVVINQNNDALYFSRECIPSSLYHKKKTVMNAYKQIGVIAFRREELLRFNQLAQTPLEQMESVDMLRILENGEKVRMILTTETMIAVDIPADINKVEQAMVLELNVVEETSL